ELERSPKATLTGYVRDGQGGPIANAVVEVRMWEDYAFTGVSTTTDASGHYSITVLAAQALFADIPGYYNRVRVATTVPVPYCCNETIWQPIATGPHSVGPAYAGAIIERDFNLTSSPTVRCGDVHGSISDEISSGGVAGATVKIGTFSMVSQDGNYAFKCPDPGFCRIPALAQVVNVTAANYYPFHSTTSSFYTPKPLTILENQDQVYNVRILPIGSGAIQGRVVSAGTTNPISGAKVHLDYYSDGTDKTVDSTSQGGFSFEARESWPPPTIIGNTNYKQTVRKHKITITHPNFESATRTGITLTAGEEKDLGDIELMGRGGM
nr:carboxypeptidase regulatory-like domain-containing protein [Candidatus Omnitrophota bacterium]